MLGAWIPVTVTEGSSLLKGASVKWHRGTAAWGASTVELKSQSWGVLGAGNVLTPSSSPEGGSTQTIGLG